MDPWWTTCVKRITAPFYWNEAAAEAAKESTTDNRTKMTKGKLGGYFIWGDRVRLASG